MLLGLPWVAQRSQTKTHRVSRWVGLPACGLLRAPPGCKATHLNVRDTGQHADTTDHRAQTNYLPAACSISCHTMSPDIKALTQDTLGQSVSITRTCCSIQKCLHSCILRAKLRWEVSSMPVDHQGPHHVPARRQLTLGILWQDTLRHGSTHQ